MERLRSVIRIPEFDVHLLKGSVGRERGDTAGEPEQRGGRTEEDIAACTHPTISEISKYVIIFERVDSFRRDIMPGSDLNPKFSMAPTTASSTDRVHHLLQSNSTREHWCIVMGCVCVRRRWAPAQGVGQTSTPESAR